MILKYNVVTAIQYKIETLLFDYQLSSPVYHETSQLQNLLCKMRGI